MYVCMYDMVYTYTTDTRTVACTFIACPRILPIPFSLSPTECPRFEFNHHYRDWPQTIKVTSQLIIVIFALHDVGIPVVKLQDHSMADQDRGSCH